MDDVALCGDGLIEKFVVKRIGAADQTISVKEWNETSSVTAIALTWDGDELAIGTKNGVVRYWNTSTWKENDGRQTTAGSVSFLAYRKGRHDLVVGTQSKGRQSIDQLLRIVDRKTGKALAWTEGHVSPAFQLAFDTLGKRLVSLSEDRTVRVWNAENGSLIARLSGSRGRVNCVAINRDATLVACGGTDKTLRIWNIAAGTKLVTECKFPAAVTAVDFHPLKNIIAVSTKTTIEFRQLVNGNLLDFGPEIAVAFTQPKEFLQQRTLRFSPEHKWVVCGTTRGRILMWSTTNGERVLDFQPDQNRAVLDLQFSSDGNRLAVMCHEYQVKVFDLTTVKSPEEIASFVQRPIRSMSMSPAGDKVVTGTYDQDATIWSVASGQQLSHIEGHRERLDAVKFSPDGRFLASSSNAEIRLWNLSPRPHNTIQGSMVAVDGFEWRDHYDMLFAFAFTTDENQMLIRGLWGGRYNGVLFNRTTGEKRPYPLCYGGDIDPTDRWVAICTKPGEFALYDLETNEKFPLKHDGTSMKSVVFNCDGSLVAGIGPGNIAVWDVAKKSQLYSFPAHIGGIRNRLAFHPRDPHLLVSGGDDSMVYLWSIRPEGYKRLRQLDGHSGKVGHMAFSRDGKRLATCGRGEVPPALLWDLETGKVLQRFLGHKIRINAVDISPDGRWFASASSDFTVRLWNSQDGTELRRFQDHSDDVYYVRFIDDGRQLMSASADGSIQIRDLRANEDSHKISHEQLEAETGLRLEKDQIQSIPQRAEWYATPGFRRR